MTWEDAFNAVRDATTTGGLYCLGFPRIVKEVFYGNIQTARIACEEMQLRRPEIEEVYLQNCVAYRLRSKKEENTMAPIREDAHQGKEEDHTIEIDESKELDREYSRLWYRMKVNHPEALKERKKGGTQQDFIDWVKNTYPELSKPSIRGHKDDKEAPITPPSAKAPAAPISPPAPPADPPAPAIQIPGSQWMPQGSNGFNFKPVVVAVSGTFTLEQLRLIQKGISMLAGNSIEEQNELIHMRKEIASILN
jgi:hypothetical protein